MQEGEDRRMRDYRFTNLLATLLLLMMLLSPFVRLFRTDEFPILAPIAMTALFALVLLSAVFAVAEHRTITTLAAAWAAVAAHSTQRTNNV